MKSKGEDGRETHVSWVRGDRGANSVNHLGILQGIIEFAVSEFCL